MDKDNTSLLFSSSVEPHPENTVTHFYLLVKMTLVPFLLGTAINQAAKTLQITNTSKMWFDFWDVTWVFCWMFRFFRQTMSVKRIRRGFTSSHMSI